MEDFDPRPLKFRGTAAHRLPDLVDKLRGEQLCISLLFNPKCQSNTIDRETPQQPCSHNVPDAVKV